MASGKTEIQVQGSKAPKKSKRKKIIVWLTIDLVVAIVIFALLLYEPAGYKPADIGSANYKQGQVHPYLTYLSSEYYNSAQRQEPFILVVNDKKMSEAYAQWSRESEGTMLFAPMVRFLPEMIVLMGTASVKGIELIVTIVLKPKIDEQGLLNLRVVKVKVGAMNITLLARIIAKKMYAKELATKPIDKQDWRVKIAASLLNDEPFKPIFPAEDKKVRLDKITIDNEQLTLWFVPAS